MTLTIRYFVSNGAIDTVTLHNVQSITQTSIGVYDITCFGNSPVTWRKVTSLAIAIESLPAAKPAAITPHGVAATAPGKTAKINLCYKCQTPFTFKRTGNILERIETATGKPHACQGNTPAAIVLPSK